MLFSAPDSLHQGVEQLYERALDVGYACDEHQLKNVDEFFAVSHTDFLRIEHGLPGLKEVDEAIVAFFRDLAKQDELAVG